MYEEADAVQYDIKYQNIINSLRFLLRHWSFEKDLVYALVHHYNANNCRVYSEMHMIDWWWETQEKLSDNVTIVSLLLTTDKTALTQHQNDLVAWSFYLIIENLSWCIRQAQFRSDMILQTFLLIVDSDRDRIKSQVWHMILSTILERKQHHLSKNMFDTHYINNWESDQRWCRHRLRWRSYEKVSFYYRRIHDKLWRTDFNYEHKEESAVLYLSDTFSEKRESHEYLTVTYSSIHSETDLTAEKKRYF